MVVVGIAGDGGGVLADDVIPAVEFLVVAEGLRREERLAASVAGEEPPAAVDGHDLASFFIVAGEKKRLLVELGDQVEFYDRPPRGVAAEASTA